MTSFMTVDASPFPGKEAYNFKRPFKRVEADERNISKALRRHVHSWILWKGDKRAGDNFEGYSGIAFDIDKLFKEAPTPQELLRAAECVKHNFPEWKKFYIYPSWSGTGLHIEIPLSVAEFMQRKNAYETLYTYYMRELSKVFEGVDDSCKDLARIIYPANPQSYIILCGKSKDAMGVEEKLLKAISKTLEPKPYGMAKKTPQRRFYSPLRTFEDRLDTSKLTSEGSRHVNCLRDMVYVANCEYYSPDKKEEMFQKIMEASTLPEKEKQSILTSVRAKYLA